MPIDWSLAKQPDIIGNAYASMRQGEAAGREQQARNAYATYAVDPEAGIKALMPYDPAAATQLSTARRQEKRQDAADSLAMSDRQKKEASERAGMLASYAQSLKALPPEARKAKLGQDAPQLIERGLTAEMIAGFDPSDQNIDQVTSEALGIKDKLDLDLKKQTFQAGREDQQFERQFKEKQFGETVRSNRVQEGQGAARLAIARQSEARQGASAMTAARGRPIPSPIATGYGENVTALSKIDAAIAALKAHPKAVGLSRVAGDNINQRLDPAGVDARAALADIGSQKLHDRSGAAVSAAESPRLMPFIPQVTDNSETAIKKLTRLKQEYLSNNSQIEAQFGPESGYQPLRMGAPTVAPAAPSAGGGTVLRFDARGNRIK